MRVRQFLMGIVVVAMLFLSCVNARELNVVLGDGEIRTYADSSKKIKSRFNLNDQHRTPHAALKRFEVLETKYDYRTGTLYSTIESQDIGGVLSYNAANTAAPAKFFPGIVNVFLYAESAAAFPVLFMRADRFVSGDNLLNFNFDRYKFERLTHAGRLEELTAWTRVGEETLSPTDNCFDADAATWPKRFEVQAFDTDPAVIAPASDDAPKIVSAVASPFLRSIIGCWNASAKLYRRFAPDHQMENQPKVLYRKKLLSNQVSEIVERPISKGDSCVAADVEGRYAFCYGSSEQGYLSVQIYDFDALKRSDPIKLKTDNEVRRSVYVVGYSRDRTRWYFVYGHPLGLGNGSSGASIYKLQLGDAPTFSAIDVGGLSKVRGVFETE